MQRKLKAQGDIIVNMKNKIKSVSDVVRKPGVAYKKLMTN